MAIDQETLMRLLTSEEGKFRAYTWQIVRDDHVVEEVVQDMAVLALQKCSQINDPGHFPAWARRTCRNLAMDAIRKKLAPTMPSEQCSLGFARKPLGATRWRGWLGFDRGLAEMCRPVDGARPRGARTSLYRGVAVW